MEILKSEFNLQNKNVLIRNAEIEDGENIIDHIKLVDEETIFLSREAGEFQIEKEEEQRLISNWNASDHDLFLVAEIDGEIAGICGLCGNHRKRYVHRADISIAIKKKFWGIGIGKNMIEEAIKWGKQNNLKRIELEVDSENTRAIILYTNLGFHIEGTIERERRLADGSYRNSYLMALLID